MSLRAPGLICLALALAPTLLQADDLEPDTHFGLQFTMATPRQDLRDATTRTGLGGGCYFEQDVDPTWSARARFDYLQYSSNDLTAVPPNLAAWVPATASELTANQASIGAEVRYHVQGAGGLFFLGGGQGSRLEFKTVSPATPGGPILQSQQKTSFKFGMALGVGYQVVPNGAVTLRYTTLSMNGLNFATLEAGLEYRF